MRPARLGFTTLSAIVLIVSATRSPASATITNVTVAL